MEIIIKHTKEEKEFAHNLEKDLKDMKKDFNWKVRWKFKYQEVTQ